MLTAFFKATLDQTIVAWFYSQHLGFIDCPLSRTLQSLLCVFGVPHNPAVAANEPFLTLLKSSKFFLQDRQVLPDLLPNSILHLQHHLLACFYSLEEDVIVIFIPGEHQSVPLCNVLKNKL